MKTIKLGKQGMEVSQLGYGCMGLTSFYGSKLPDDEVVSMLSKEELIGRAISAIGRENIIICSKTGVGFKFFPKPSIFANGSRAFIREQCLASLDRLGVDCIDLFYLHRIDQKIPIEVSMLEMKKLVEEGKIKYVGLSECSAATLRRAHKIHPITAVQMEYSLWCRGIEEEVLPACAELGIGLVAYSPLGRGFFGGSHGKGTKYGLSDYRSGQERLQGEAGETNAKFLENVRKIAEDKGVSMPQLALAWVEAQQFRLNGAGVVAIPGTTKEKNLISNVKSTEIQLTAEDIAALEAAVPIDQVQGDRYEKDHIAFETDKNPELSAEQAAELGISLD